MLDCLIIGAGPAGLTAATYLARYRRNIGILDAGSPRAALIPTTHNFPAFPNGVSGEHLLARLREQAAVHGVEVTEARVDSLLRQGEGFIARAGSQAWGGAHRDPGDRPARPASRLPGTARGDACGTRALVPDLRWLRRHR
jgi:thioredoxin reductase (NADPH)